MKQTVEEIFDQALIELRSGKTISEVVSAYPEHQAELQSLLEMAVLASSIPHNVVPTPMRRRKFAEQLQRSWWLNTVGYMKFGIMPLTLVLMLLGARTVIVKAADSLPNDNLYTLKRAGERIQLTFTRDTNKHAGFQVELMQRRLEEVKQAAASQDPEQEAAALAELKDQTEKTFATVPQVAAATAITSKDSSLLDGLVAANKQQQEVLSSIQGQPETTETKEIAATALTDAKANGKTLLALVATVQEQALADLQNKVSLSGDATTNAGKTTIKIDATTFVITADTVITSLSGEPMALADLPIRSKANVVGSKTDGVITAKIISLLEVSAESPEPTATPAPKPSVPAPTEPTAPQPDQNEVTSGVIIEPAAP